MKATHVYVPPAGDAKIILDQCWHTEVRKVAYGVTVRQPCLRPESEHPSTEQ